MSQSVLRSVLSAACVAATSVLSIAQSAPVEVVKTRRQEPVTTQDPATRERVQVRLAEVISILEEGNLTEEQRERARTKLTEIRDRLARDEATRADAVRMYALRSDDGEPRARFRKVEVAEGADPVIVEMAEPSVPTPVLPPPLPAKAPKAPKPPKPPKAPRALMLAEAAQADAADAEARAGQHKATLELLLKERAKQGADEERRLRVEVEGLAQRHHLVEVERAERAAELAEVHAKRAHDRAKAQADDGAGFGAVRGRKAAGSQNRAGADAADDDLRAMIEEMRAEMREIRALIRQMRAKSQDIDEVRRNALAPARGSFGPAGSFGGSAAPRAGMQGTSAGFGLFAPASGGSGASAFAPGRGALAPAQGGGGSLGGVGMPGQGGDGACAPPARAGGGFAPVRSSDTFAN